MKYNFAIDEKVMIWQRHHYSVEANSVEEATNIMKKEFSDPEFDSNIFEESEFLFETIDTLEDEETGSKELVFENTVILSN